MENPRVSYSLVIGEYFVLLDTIIMKKTLIIGLVVVVGIVGLMLWGQSVQTKAEPQPSGEIRSLSAPETAYNFGAISMRDGTVEHIFIVTNSSEKDIEIKRVFTSCMCTAAYIESANEEKGPFGMEGMGYIPPADETIKAGESRAVRVVFDPNAHGPAGVGAIDRLVYLTDVSGNAFQFEITAVVTP